MDVVATRDAFERFETHAFVVPMLQHLGGQFPKTCSVCSRLYGDFGEYVKRTTPIGTPVCFDQDEPSLSDPVGTVSMANCECGTTLVLECPSHGEQYDRFVAAIRADAHRYSITIAEVLELMRNEIRARA
jgi:hypothetical protein